MDNLFTTEDIKYHYEKNWKATYAPIQWKHGPMKNINSDFTILEFEPSAFRNCWTYATCGMSLFTSVNSLEIFLFSRERDESIVELLTSIAYYQYESGHKLGLWHTVNFGRPWKPSSLCEYGLISLPYLDGPKLENFFFKKNVLVKFYWLVPITNSERNYKIAYGVEAIETLFESNKINYLDPLRSGVV